ncbi:MAG: zinc ABC transporter substrate-binding protein [Candidatus Marinimicrobia bacterium]|nr:zinc ABC transporter substrate-binding protein [Candidatus Neomarinimicrobiota bacterium]
MKRFIRTIIVICLFTSLFSCQPINTNSDRLAVTVSIAPLKEFVREIGGDKVTVDVMIPPGAFPHSYEPRPAQLRRLKESDLYIKIGTPVEFEINWMNKLVQINPQMRVIDTSPGIDLIRSENNIDPHIWLSPKNAKMMVQSITSGLIIADSVNGQYYRKNQDIYLRKLDQLDQQISALLINKVRPEFIVLHPSWIYFARDYGLIQIGIEHEGKEPSARHLQSLIDEARLKNIPTVFIAPQDNPKNAYTIANELSASVQTIDPLNEHYLKNLLHVAQLIAEVVH